MPMYHQIGYDKFLIMRSVVYLPNPKRACLPPKLRPHGNIEYQLIMIFILNIIKIRRVCFIPTFKFILYRKNRFPLSNFTGCNIFVTFQYISQLAVKCFRAVIKIIESLIYQRGCFCCGGNYFLFRH